MGGADGSAGGGGCHCHGTRAPHGRAWAPVHGTCGHWRRREGEGAVPMPSASSWCPHPSHTARRRRLAVHHRSGAHERVKRRGSRRMGMQRAHPAVVATGLEVAVATVAAASMPSHMMQCRWSHGACARGQTRCSRRQRRPHASARTALRRRRCERRHSRRDGPTPTSTSPPSTQYVSATVRSRTAPPTAAFPATAQRPLYAKPSAGTCSLLWGLPCSASASALRRAEPTTTARPTSSSSALSRRR